jgi:hypothetical protein
MKQKTSFALSDEARRLLLWLAAYFGVSQAGVIEMLLRDKMRQVAGKEQGEKHE